MNTNNLPKDLLHPGGFVEECMNYINETAVCHQPMFALGAALSLAGILYGRRVQTEDGQRTNLFVMSVGYTSCGKDHALKSIARILDAAGATNLRLGQVTSDSAIEYALKREPRQIALIDEAGHFFGNVNDPNAKGTAAHAIKPALLELWSSANATWKGKQRVPKDGKDAVPVEVVNPHFCLYATTQPQILFASMSRNDLRDGWLSRNLFFISETRPKPVVKPMKSVPTRLLAEVLAWKQDGPTLTVPTDPAARPVFDAFNSEIYTAMLRGDTQQDETNYLYGKALENATRIALILAVSRSGGGAAKIEASDATFATTLVGYLVHNLIETVRGSIADSPVEKALQQIRRAIARSGRVGILKGELTRQTQYISRTARDQIIADLLEIGEVLEHAGPTCGVRYYFKAFAPAETQAR